MRLPHRLAALHPALPGDPAERAPRNTHWSDELAHAVAGFWRRLRPPARTTGAGPPGSPRPLAQLRADLRRYGLTSFNIAGGLDLLGSVASREIGLTPYPVQRQAAALLLRGMAVEMDTGEGKTVTIALAAACAALAGLPTHVLSANDYLTARDAATLRPFFDALGLTLGVVVHDTDHAARQQAYAADITYATSREIVFDYLRDRLVLGHRNDPLQRRVEPLFGSFGCHRRLLMRGLHFAIVDEADSVLIDEARTPLIIAGTGGAHYDPELLSHALALARELVEEDDFVLERAERRVRLTTRGRERGALISAPLGPAWAGRARREDLLVMALSALHLYRRDHDYVVREEVIEIVDPLSGRVSQGRAWERGLHQLIELKEGCPPSLPRNTIARLGYPAFFRRYRHLAGMSGTLREVRGELWSEYGLPFARVPRHLPNRREHLGTRVFASAASRWQATAVSSAAMLARQRAVLVGTAAVAASEAAAATCAARGLQVRVLNARQDAEEAAIVAGAGRTGAVTIATSMAGRGTDIDLDDTVRAAGGLHVILTQHYDAARIDRQLAGRGARQGDPGSFELLVALEDVQFHRPVATMLARLAASGVDGELCGVRGQCARFALWLEQRGSEHRDRLARKALRSNERRLLDVLAIAGREG